MVLVALGTAQRHSGRGPDLDVLVEPLAHHAHGQLDVQISRVVPGKLRVVDHVHRTHGGRTGRGQSVTQHGQQNERRQRTFSAARNHRGRRRRYRFGRKTARTT